MDVSTCKWILLKTSSLDVSIRTVCKGFFWCEMLLLPLDHTKNYEYVKMYSNISLSSLALSSTRRLLSMEVDMVGYFLAALNLF